MKKTLLLMTAIMTSAAIAQVNQAITIIGAKSMPMEKREHVGKRMVSIARAKKGECFVANGGRVFYTTIALAKKHGYKPFQTSLAARKEAEKQTDSSGGNRRAMVQGARGL